MKLVPNFINPANSSNAEKRLFELFKNSNDLSEWVCLHSLGVSSHISKREGEIDFLLVGPLGVFVLEVKGGRINRRNGRWYFTDRFGRVNSKNESPFNQAKTALYSIRSDITEKFGHEMYSHVFGYGVMFPDVVFNEESPEWDQRMVFDKRDVDESISSFVTRISDYWDSKQKSRKRLTHKQIKDITEYLRGDFEVIRSISSSVNESEKEIVNITNEQFTLLDSLDLNPRTIFMGSAGTGKTLLAMEKARRNAFNGIDTLFLCYNRLLADYTAETLESELGEFSKFITVSSMHSYIFSAIKVAGQESALRSDDSGELYNKTYPKVFLSLENSKHFEELIVDEAQDILTEEYIKVLDRLIDKGLTDGKWLLCMDQENQNIYDKLDKTTLEKLFNIASSFRLTINCRNTKSIAQQAKLVSQIDTGITVKASGAPVKYLWYRDETDQAHRVSEAISQLLADGIEPEDITIISPHRLRGSLAGSGRLRLNVPLFNIDTRKTSFSINGHIGYSTIASFKGLENKVIIITDVSEIGEKSAILNYVGFTRARSHLVISLPKSLKKELGSRISSILDTQKK